jgi:hypothetical protein
MKKVYAAVALVVLLAGPATARADAVLDWNAIALSTIAAPTPFAQARFLAIVQLAVFEAVNSVTGEYAPYLDPPLTATAGASADSAAVAAAHAVLLKYFPASAATLTARRAESLAAIPDAGKAAGIAAGLAAAEAVMALRANDGSAAAAWYLPASTLAGEWQLTPSCNPLLGGVLYHWGKVTPFGIDNASDFIPGPPPALGSNAYRKDYEEVKRMGGVNSTERSLERSDNARFYVASSPGFVLNTAARQLSAARGDSLAKNAWALALLNMSINDSLIASFATKYTYYLWRPETAIRTDDGNDRTTPDPGFVPFVLTPCFPSYPSNHASGTNGGLEILRRVYGSAGHTISIPNAALGMTKTYSSLEQIADDVDDARVLGGIHFRFDQVAGNRLGRAVATFIYKEQPAEEGVNPAW